MHALFGRGSANGHERARGRRAMNQSRRGWRPRGGVQHDAEGLARPTTVEPDRQGRIIGQHGSDPDEDRVRFTAKPMCLETRGVARDPFRCAVDVRDLAVERCGSLQRHVRSAFSHRGQEDPVERRRGRFENAVHHLEPGLPQCGQPAARDERIRVRGRDDDAPDTRCDHHRGARRCTTMMHARL